MKPRKHFLEVHDNIRLHVTRNKYIRMLHPLGKRWKRLLHLSGFHGNQLNDRPLAASAL